LSKRNVNQLLMSRELKRCTVVTTRVELHDITLRQSGRSLGAASGNVAPPI
jgi:hypothetical protein